VSRIRFIACAALIPCVATATLAAQAHDRPHRDAAAKLGTVHFPTSCRPAVAPRFDRAVALLHSFEFREAIAGFEAVLAEDSTCAMAHWGLAMSRWTNPMSTANRAPAQLKQGRASWEAATRLASRATPRERDWIEAVGQLYANFETVDQGTRVAAYERAMDSVVARHPGDSEARIFHALALTASASPTDKTYAKQLKAGAILEAAWREQPDHPGIAHYIIHTYDVPALAARARVAAERYARIAPSAAHALHMPSHTFTRVGLWKESVETNRRSAELALRDGSISEALHASDYAAYAYLQMRRDSAAKAIVDGLPALAAKFNPDAVTGAAPGSAGIFALAAIPARWALERRNWAEAAALVPRSTQFEWSDAMTWFARSLGASHTGDLTAARAAVDTLTAIEARLRAKGEGYWSEQVAIQALGAQAWVDYVENRTDSALARMRRAADREDATEKAAVTPGPLAPARELLGDMLMLMDRPVDALVEYRASLEREPGRYRTLDGARRAAMASGDRAAAARYSEELRKLEGA
jgi:hypothetical protein